MFTGNELGALLGWWMFSCWKKTNTDSTAVKNIYMLASTVSSKILRAIALKEGFHFEVTHTYIHTHTHTHSYTHATTHKHIVMVAHLFYLS